VDLAWGVKNRGAGELMGGDESSIPGCGISVGGGIWGLLRTVYS